MAGGKGQGVVRSQQEVAGGGPARPTSCLISVDTAKVAAMAPISRAGRQTSRFQTAQARATRAADHRHPQRRRHRGHGRQDGGGERVPGRHEAVVHRRVQVGHAAVRLHGGEHGPEDRLPRDQQARGHEEEPPLGRQRQAGGGSRSTLGKEHPANPASGNYLQPGRSLLGVLWDRGWRRGGRYGFRRPPGLRVRRFEPGEHLHEPGDLLLPGGGLLDRVGAVDQGKPVHGRQDLEHRLRPWLRRDGRGEVVRDLRRRRARIGGLPAPVRLGAAATAACPAGAIRPADSRRSIRSTFRADHTLLGPRRVIRWKELSSSRRRPCPSIQPKHSASCSAAS